MKRCAIDGDTGEILPKSLATNDVHHMRFPSDTAIAKNARWGFDAGGQSGLEGRCRTSLQGCF